jgi:hypothetical protein
MTDLTYDDLAGKDLEPFFDEYRSLSTPFSRAERLRGGRADASRLGRLPLDPEPTGPEYVAIIVHKDVLADAKDFVTMLGDSGWGYEALRPLLDLVEPLPESDINGVTPRVVLDFDAKVYDQSDSAEVEDPGWNLARFTP